MSKPDENLEIAESYNVPLEDFLKRGLQGSLQHARAAKEEADRAAFRAQVMATFRDQDHARQVWDDWDGIDEEGELAHHYLNLIGDGHYCSI